MEPNYLCYNNKFYLENQPIFGLNRALKYGDGLFESIRIRNGEACYLEYHLIRLTDGLKALQIEFPLEKRKEIEFCINQLLIKNEIDSDGSLRLTVFRTGAGKYKPESNQAEYFIETQKLESNSFKLNKKGLSIGICQSINLTINRFSKIKSLNSLPYIQASIELMNQQDLDALILLNNSNRIVEATSSNIFLVINNELLTPKISEGCLDGIMRKIVIQKVKKAGIQFRETELTIPQLEEASEIFLTNSIKGIQWVSSYKAKRYFNKVSNLLFESLLNS